jgi:hypothetical protein
VSLAWTGKGSIHPPHRWEMVLLRPWSHRGLKEGSGLGHSQVQMHTGGYKRL